MINLHFTKITKLFDLENLELYGMSLPTSSSKYPHQLSVHALSVWYSDLVGVLGASFRESEHARRGGLLQENTV